MILSEAIRLLFVLAAFLLGALILSFLTRPLEPLTLNVNHSGYIYERPNNL